MIESWFIKMVGEPGFEPGTSSSRTKRAPELRHSPNMDKDYICAAMNSAKMSVERPNGFTLDESCLSNRFDDPVRSFTSYNPSCVLHCELGCIEF